MSDVYFVVETFTIDDNRELKAVQRDEDGFFKGVPMAVLGVPTRNRTVYDVQSVIDGISSKDSMLRTRLEEGTLTGEWGHPVVDYSTPFGMQRLGILDPQKESHSFKKIYVKHVDDLNVDIVYADVKPTGPYGKYFLERMEDPTLNLAFSLRSMARENIDRRTGMKMRKVVAMFTFDAGVPSGGYKEASKRYIDASEQLSCASTDIVHHKFCKDDIVELSHVAMESFTNTELNDLFEATEVSLTKTTKVFMEEGLMIDIEKNTKAGVFHTLMRRNR